MLDSQPSSNNLSNNYRYDSLTFQNGSNKEINNANKLALTEKE